MGHKSGEEIATLLGGWVEETRIYTEPIDSQVGRRFHHSVYEIRRAAYCLAYGLSTASVVHSMRALEPALDEFGPALGLSFTDKHTWGEKLDKIEGVVIQQKKARGKNWDHLQLCQQATADFSRFKDAWRNVVSHKGKYDFREARSVYDRTIDFLSLLAKKLPSGSSIGFLLPPEQSPSGAQK